MHTIIIADDDPVIIKILGNYLSKKYNVIEAGDGKEVIEKTMGEKPDLILMDIKMPVIDGIQATKILKGNWRTRNIPVILFTGIGDNQAVGFDAGADDYIEKPFDMKTLSARLEARMREVEYIQEMEKKIDDESNELIISYDKLQDAHEQLQASTAEVEVTHAVLVKAHEKMRVLESIKRDFLQVISHELRTPLTPILGYLACLKEWEAADLSPQLREIVEEMFLCGKNMQLVIDELLEAATVQGDNARLEFVKETDIGLVLHQVVNGVKKHTKEKGIDIETHIPMSLLLEGDKRRLTEIFTNLIRNAVKFSRDSGKIRVAAEERGDCIEIIISDNGIGIPRDRLDKIYDAFYQVEPPSTRHYEGLGLGLYLVKRLLDLHSGRIAVESVEGDGTTFTVFLPKRRR